MQSAFRAHNDETHTEMKIIFIFSRKFSISLSAERTDKSKMHSPNAERKKANDFNKLMAMPSPNASVQLHNNLPLVFLPL